MIFFYYVLYRFQIKTVIFNQFLKQIHLKEKNKFKPRRLYNLLNEELRGAFQLIVY